MKDLLQLHWNEARRHEAAGDVPGATRAYEAMLAVDPMQVVPHLRLSRFAQGADRYVESHAQALRASAAVRNSGACKEAGFVTLRLLAFAEDGEVVRLIRSLDWSDADVLKQSAVLAQHLWLVGQHELAMEFMTHVATRVRPSHLLSHTRANVLRSLGKLGEATDCYEYALKLSPHDAYTHASLAYHQADPAPGSRLPRIRAAQASHAADSMEQAHLFYALFKELDDRGETAGAWSALQQGAAIVRAKLGHNMEAEALGFRALQRSMPGPARIGAIEAHAGPVPVFIVGMPRTGTTLLDRILGNHPDVASVGERNDFAAAISETSDHFFAGGLEESDWSKLDGMDYLQAGALYMARMAPHHGGSRFFIDKNPRNFFNVGLILRALPQARILCMRRDPMDACFSNLKEMFEGGAYPYSFGLAELAAHQRGFQALLEHWTQLAPDSVQVVDYETLVRDGDDALAAILHFCGLQPVTGMLDITSNTAPVTTASSSQVRQPIHDRNIGAWRKYAAQLEPLHLLLEDAP